MKALSNYYDVMKDHCGVVVVGSGQGGGVTASCPARASTICPSTTRSA
ncbi:hypothetical protein [Spirosoma linguale]